MIKINHRMIAESPLFTGSDRDLGIKSELRKQKVKMLNPIIVSSKFIDEKQRESALVDILTILYNHISPDYRMLRGKDIWGEFKTRILSAAGSKSRKTFLTRYANSFDVDVYDTNLLKRIDMFDDHEFVMLLREEIDYIMLRMRSIKETRQDAYKKIKTLESVIEGLKDKLEEIEQKPEILNSKEGIEKEIDNLYEEIKGIENSKDNFELDMDNLTLQESELSYKKEFHEVPYFTGNSIAGILRRLVMEDYFRCVGISQVPDFAYHTLFTGGVLKIDVKDEVLNKVRNILDVSTDKIKLQAKNLSNKTGEENLDLIDELAFICPPLRLFGAAIGNTMLESELQVSNAELLCAENNNGDISLWSLLDDVFLIRKDSSKQEWEIEIIETSAEPHQMKYIMETIIKGAEFEHAFICKSDNILMKATFHAALKLFCDYPYIGGKSSRGFGQVNLSDLESKLDNDLIEYYYKHLEENKEEMRKYFDVTQITH